MSQADQSGCRPDASEACVPYQELFAENARLRMEIASLDRQA